jgi:hypothetical protein
LLDPVGRHDSLPIRRDFIFVAGSIRLPGQ